MCQDSSLFNQPFIKTYLWYLSFCADNIVNYLHLKNFGTVYNKLAFGLPSGVGYQIFFDDFCTYFVDFMD